MKKVAYVFPGQGSQFVGMGRDIYEKYESAREIFKEADKALGFSLSSLCFEGDEDVLTETSNAQPALVTMSMACLKAIQEVAGDEFPTADYVAGHSLGEYSALCASDAFDFSTTVKLARERGRLMQEAGKLCAGGMSAVIGLPDETVSAICDENGVWPANYNCPGQVAISGEKANVKAATKRLKEEGAKLVVRLQVSGAFHSPLMQPASDGLKNALDAVKIENPTIPVIGNTKVQQINSAEEVKLELAEQLCNCVQWTRSIEYLIEQGVTQFIEIGPGNVLTGLIRRIDKDVEVSNIDSVKAIEEFLPSQV